MKLLSIQVGLPQDITYRGKSIRTSIFKSPVAGPVYVGELNIEGDKQSDLRVHGGRDKAVYAYSFEAYSWAKDARPDLNLEYGAFGENLTFDQMSEERIFIGDSFEIGEAVLQVTQPRMPCYKLAVKFDDPAIIKMFMKARRPGIYFRVLKEGNINVGDQLKLVGQEKVRVSVDELFRLTTEEIPKERLAEILKVEALPESWRSEIKESLQSQ